LHTIIVIPARYHSSRLPGKPLVMLNGVSMIQRTYEQCVKGFARERTYVATDDQRIVDHCNAAGMNVVMTSPDCLTGTDRVAEVARSVPADLYLNVQGDEPLFNPDDISVMMEAAAAYPGDVLNGFAPIDEEAFRSPTIPKVVARPDGRLLYMSRGSIPTTKGHRFVRAWRQVCIYAFTPASLDAFAACTEKTPLEAIEDIEILRILELGFEVRMVPLSVDSVAVDTPEDVEKVERILRERESSGVLA
jgi:3-deoxy-manno-octulosonate cytidylyltransferase (CMP-KDO synthetase)